MLRRLRRVVVMTVRIWFLAQPERRQGVDRRRCPDRRLDQRMGEMVPSRRCRERRYICRLLTSS